MNPELLEQIKAQLIASGENPEAVLKALAKDLGVKPATRVAKSTRPGQVVYVEQQLEEANIPTKLALMVAGAMLLYPDVVSAAEIHFEKLKAEEPKEEFDVMKIIPLVFYSFKRPEGGYWKTQNTQNHLANFYNQLQADLNPTVEVEAAPTVSVLDAIAVQSEAEAEAEKVEEIKAEVEVDNKPKKQREKEKAEPALTF